MSKLNNSRRRRAKTRRWCNGTARMTQYVLICHLSWRCSLYQLVLGQRSQFLARSQMGHHRDAWIDDRFGDFCIICLQHCYPGHSQEISCFRGSYGLRDESLRPRLRVWANGFRTSIRAVWAQDALVRGLLDLRHLSNSGCSGTESLDHFHLPILGGLFCKCTSGHCMPLPHFHGPMNSKLRSLTSVLH